VRVRSGSAERAPALALDLDRQPRNRLLRAFPAFRHRDFVLFWSGSLVSNIGTWMQNVTVPYVLLFVMHTSPIWVGIATVSQFLPSVVLGPYAGAFADRFHRKTVVIISQSAQGVVAAVMWAAWVANVRSPTAYVLLVGAGGIANGLNMPAFQALVGDIVPREDLLNAVTVTLGQFNAARAVGPALAGVVLATWGPSWTFLINAISFIAVVVAIAVLHTAPFVAKLNRPSIINEFAEGVRYACRHLGVVVAVLTALAVAMIGLPVAQMAAIMARDVFHVGPGRYGVLAGAYGAGAVIGAVVLSGLSGRFRRGRLVRTGILSSAVVLAAFALAPSFWFAVVALGLCGLGFIMCMPALNASIQLGVEERMRGRALGLYFIGLTGGFPLGSLLQSWLAEIVGVRQTVALASVAMALLGLLYLARSRLVDSLDMTPSEPLAAAE
jgi:MFS family permease